MPHDKFGREIEVGDIVSAIVSPWMGELFNKGSREKAVAAVVFEITPGADSCNLQIAYPRLLEMSALQGGVPMIAMNGGNAGPLLATVEKTYVNAKDVLLLQKANGDVPSGTTFEVPAVRDQHRCDDTCPANEYHYRTGEPVQGLALPPSYSVHDVLETEPPRDGPLALTPNFCATCGGYTLCHPSGKCPRCEADGPTAEPIGTHSIGEIKRLDGPAGGARDKQAVSSQSTGTDSPFALTDDELGRIYKAIAATGIRGGVTIEQQALRPGDPRFYRIVAPATRGVNSGGEIAQTRTHLRAEVIAYAFNNLAFLIECLQTEREQHDSERKVNRVRPERYPPFEGTDVMDGDENRP